MPITYEQPEAETRTFPKSHFKTPLEYDIGLWEAAFGRENTVAGVNRWMEQNSFPSDNSFNLIEYAKDDPLFQSYPDKFYAAESRPQYDYMRNALQKQLHYSGVLERAGVAGFGAAVIAGVADPTVLFPGGTIYRGVKIGQAVGRSALSTGIAGGVAVGAQEGVLQSAINDRSIFESTANIAFGALFSAGLGAGISGLTSPAFRAKPGDLGAAATPTHELATRGPVSAVPEDVVVPDEFGNISRVSITGKVLGWMHGVYRQGNNPNSSSVREAMTLLDSGGLIREDANGNPVAVGPDAVNEIKTVMGTTHYNAFRTSIDDYNKYKAETPVGDRLTRDEVNQLATQALAQGIDVYDGPDIVKKIAANYRETVFNKFRKELEENKITVKEILEDGDTYFPRVPNREAIKRDQLGFEDLLAEYYGRRIESRFIASLEAIAKKQGRLVDDLSDLTTEDIDAVRKDLQDLITESADELDDNSRAFLAREQELEKQLKEAKTAPERAAIRQSIKDFKAEEGTPEFEAFKALRKDANRRFKNLSQGIVATGRKIAEIDEQIAKLNDADFKTATTLITRGRNLMAKLDQGGKVTQEELRAFEQEVQASNDAIGRITEKYPGLRDDYKVPMTAEDTVDLVSMTNLYADDKRQQLVNQRAKYKAWVTRKKKKGENTEIQEQAIKELDADIARFDAEAADFREVTKNLASTTHVKDKARKDELAETVAQKTEEGKKAEYRGNAVQKQIDDFDKSIGMTAQPTKSIADELQFDPLFDRPQREDYTAEFIAQNQDINGSVDLLERVQKFLIQKSNLGKRVEREVSAVIHIKNGDILIHTDNEQTAVNIPRELDVDLVEGRPASYISIHTHPVKEVVGGTAARPIYSSFSDADYGVTFFNGSAAEVVFSADGKYYFAFSWTDDVRNSQLMDSKINSYEKISRFGETIIDDIHGFILDTQSDITELAIANPDVLSSKIIENFFPEFEDIYELATDITARALHATGMTNYVSNRRIPSLSDNLEYRRLATNAIERVQKTFEKDFPFVKGGLSESRLASAFAQSSDIGRILDLVKTTKKGSSSASKSGKSNQSYRTLVSRGEPGRDRFLELTKTQINKAGLELIPKTPKGNPRTVARHRNEEGRLNKERDAAQAQLDRRIQRNHQTREMIKAHINTLTKNSTRIISARSLQRGRKIARQEKLLQDVKDRIGEKISDKEAVDARAVALQERMASLGIVKEGDSLNVTAAARNAAQATANKMVGTYGRVPLSLGAVERGSLLERTLDIDVLEEFSNGKSYFDYLEQDISVLSKKYSETVAADLSVYKRFGSINPFVRAPDSSQDTPIMIKIQNDYAAKREEASQKYSGKKLEKELIKLHKSQHRAIHDLNTAVQAVRHLHGVPDDPSSIPHRMGTAVLNLNVIRFMGMVVPSSWSDPARFVFKQGIGRIYKDNLLNFAGNFDALHATAKELRFLGVGLDYINSAVLRKMTDIYEDQYAGTMVERGLQYASNNMGKIAGFDYWNTLGKTFAGATTTMAISRIVKEVAEGTVNKNDARFLIELGIDSRMANNIYNEIYNNPEGSSFHKGVRVPNSINWAEETRIAFGSAINRMTDDTIVTPDLERPWIMSSTLTGRLIFQFRSFGFASNVKTLMAGEQQLRYGNLNILTSMVLAVGLGIMGYKIYGILSGGETYEKSRDADFGKLLDEGIARSGLTGALANAIILAQQIPATAPYASFSGEGSVRSHSPWRTPLVDTLGPTLSTLKDISTVATTLHDPNEATINSGKRLLPYNTLAYGKGMMNAVADRIKENVQ